MDETETEYTAASSEPFVALVNDFHKEISNWCIARGFSIEYGAVTLNQVGLDKYEAPILYITKRGEEIGRVVPIAARVVGAHGLVELIGYLSREQLTYRIPSTSTAPRVPLGKSGLLRRLSGVHCAGWYWREARVRKPLVVDEGMFIDLLTHVSGYEIN